MKYVTPRKKDSISTEMHLRPFNKVPKRSSGSYDNIRNRRSMLSDQLSTVETPLLADDLEPQCIPFYPERPSLTASVCSDWPSEDVEAPPFPLEQPDIFIGRSSYNDYQDDHCHNKLQSTDQHIIPPASLSLRIHDSGTLAAWQPEPVAPTVLPQNDIGMSPTSERSRFSFELDDETRKPSELVTMPMQNLQSDAMSVDMGCLELRCMPCLKSVYKQKNKPGNNNRKGSPKGLAKMTLSGLQTEKALPGLQSLVANYAQMLYKDKTQFVDTLFRAVKLNKVDVIRVLCKIIQKSGLKLHEQDMREPESSATILHVALLYNNIETIDFLLGLNDPDLILAKYTTIEYHNQTGLHVAVANGNAEVTEKLLLALQGQERQVLINTLADGNYFRSRHPHGQLCLTAAAWAGHCEVVKLLVKYGGNMALQNSNGNTLLHSIILQSATITPHAHAGSPGDEYRQTFDTIWQASLIRAETLNYDSKNAQHRKLQEKQMQVNIFKQLMTIRNENGYTPLALATVTMSPILQYMLDLDGIYRIPQSKLGSIAWVTYDISDITSFASGKYNKFSVLHILAHSGELLSRGADPNAVNDIDIFSIEPVRTILERKWSVYRIMYIFWCILHLLYMITFTACTIEANSSPLFTKFVVKNNHSFNVKWWLGVFCILPLIYIILEFLDLFGNRPYRVQYMANQNMMVRLIKCVSSEWTIIGNGPYRCVMLGFSAFSLQWFVLYALKDPSQDIALAMSLLLGWIFVLFFTRGCRVTCRFSLMIQNLFLSDLIYFLTVYGIVLVGFSFAMNAMFTYIADAETAISKVFYDMMNVVTDLDSKQSTEESRHYLFTKLLLIVYAIVAVILLLNMLIAMMNTSYEIVTVTRCNLWKQQQLSIMLMMERRLFWLKALCSRSEDGIWTEGAQEGEVRYLMDVTMLHSSK